MSLLIDAKIKLYHVLVCTAPEVLTPVEIDLMAKLADDPDIQLVLKNKLRKCAAPACQNLVTPEQVERWGGFCDECLDKGLNFH